MFSSGSVQRTNFKDHFMASVISPGTPPQGCLCLLNPGLFVRTLWPLTTWSPLYLSGAVTFQDLCSLRLSQWLSGTSDPTGACLLPLLLPPCTQSAVSASPEHLLYVLSVAVRKGHSRQIIPISLSLAFWISKSYIRCTCLNWTLHCLLLRF